MKTLLVLARGELNTFYTINNESIFKGLPIKVVMLVDRGNCGQLGALEGVHQQIVVRWNEKEELKLKVQALHEEHQFCGVATVDESNVELAASLRELLRLPGMQPAQAELFRDKIKMKEKLKQHNIRVPYFTSCSHFDHVSALLKSYGKLVIKPIDGFGSKQVEFVTNTQELQAWYSQNEAELDVYEAEEFIEGPLFHVNALVIDGVAKSTAAAGYLPGMSNVDFAAGTPFVSVMVEDPAFKRRLVEYSDQINAALGLQNGVTHLECFVTKDEEIIFCEIGLRPGGGGIVWMIESQFGINYSQAVFALEANEAAVLPTPKDHKNKVAGLIGMRSNLSGFITQSAELKDFSEDCIKLKQINASTGNFKAASAHCTDFLGLFIFDSDTTEHFNQNWQSFYQTFQEKLVLNCI